MRSLVSNILVSITWMLTVAALLALSISAGLFDLSRPAKAATAALSSPAGQRLATDFIADQLMVAVPELGEKRSHDLAAKVAADPDTLVALRRAKLKSGSAPQDRAALLDVVASQLKETNPKVAAATEKYAGRVRSDSDQAASGGAFSQPSGPVGGLLKRVQQFTGGASNASAVMSDLKERLSHLARLLAALAGLTALGALLVSPSRARVVRSFGWMLISISLIPAAIGWLVPDLVLARMSSDWAQALAVGLREGGNRLIGLFIALLLAGVALVVLGTLGARLGSALTPTRGSRGRSGASFPSAGRSAAPMQQPRSGPPVAPEPAATRLMETVHDDRGYAASPAGYPYPASYPQSQAPVFPGDPYPDYAPYDGEPTGQEPYRPGRNDDDRRR